MRVLPPLAFIQSAKRTELRAAPAEGLTSSGTKDTRHNLSQEGVTFHQESDLRWSGRKVTLVCGFKHITISG